MHELFKKLRLCSNITILLNFSDKFLDWRKISLFNTMTDIYRSFEGSKKDFKEHLYNFNLHYLALVSVQEKFK